MQASNCPSYILALLHHELPNSLRLTLCILRYSHFGLSVVLTSRKACHALTEGLAHFVSWRGSVLFRVITAVCILSRGLMRLLRNGTRCRRISSRSFTWQAHCSWWLRAEMHSVACMLEQGWAGANFGKSQRLNWRWSRSKRLGGCACNPAIGSAILFVTSINTGAIAEQQDCSRGREVQPAKRVYQSIKLTEEVVGIDGAGRAA